MEESHAQGVVVETATEEWGESSGLHISQAEVDALLAGKWRNIRRKKYIHLDLLPLPLAEDERYSTILPVLWRDFRRDHKRAPEEIRTDTIGERITVWLYLLHRWVGFGVEGSKQGLNNERALLGMYRLEYGQYHRIDTDKSTASGYISLNELKNYLGELGEDLQIGIPFPAKLEYEEDRSNNHSTETQDKVARPNVEARWEKAAEITRKLQEKTPNIPVSKIRLNHLIVTLFEGYPPGDGAFLRQLKRRGITFQRGARPKK